MEIKKMKKKMYGEEKCALYFSSSSIKLNAVSRDALGDPDYIKVEYESGQIILKSGGVGDFKITKSKTGQSSFSGSAFMGRVVCVPQKEKIYGTVRNKALYFEIPEEYRGIKSKNI